VAVIDESDDQNFVDRWANLRAVWPDRRFCLLQPQFNADQVNRPPDVLADPLTLFAQVVRDEGTLPPDDWYELCNLDEGQAVGMTRAGTYP
jgi:hypothetical protein